MLRLKILATDWLININKAIISLNIITIKVKENISKIKKGIRTCL